MGFSYRHASTLALLSCAFALGLEPWRSARAQDPVPTQVTLGSCELTLQPTQIAQARKFSEAVREEARADFILSAAFQRFCKFGANEEIECTLKLQPVQFSLNPSTCEGGRDSSLEMFLNGNSELPLNVLDLTSAYLGKSSQIGQRADWDRLSGETSIDAELLKALQDERGSELLDLIKAAGANARSSLPDALGVGVGELSYSSGDPSRPIDGDGLMFRPTGSRLTVKVMSPGAGSVFSGTVDGAGQASEPSPPSDRFSLSRLMETREEPRMSWRSTSAISVNPTMVVSVPADEALILHLSAGTKLSAQDRESAEQLGIGFSAKLQELLLVGGYQHSFESLSDGKDSQRGSFYAGFKTQLGSNCNLEIGGRLDLQTEGSGKAGGEFFAAVKISF